MNEWLDGKKVLISGIAAALTGLGTAVGTLQDGFQIADLQVWGVALTLVMGIFGFGHKLHKLTEAVKDKEPK